MQATRFRGARRCGVTRVAANHTDISLHGQATSFVADSFLSERHASAGSPQELSRCAPTPFEGLMTRSVIRALNYESTAGLTCTTEISGQFRNVILGPSSGSVALPMPLAPGRDLPVHSWTGVTSADSSRSASASNVSAQAALVSSPLPRLTS